MVAVEHFQRNVDLRVQLAKAAQQTGHKVFGGAHHRHLEPATGQALGARNAFAQTHPTPGNGARRAGQGLPGLGQVHAARHHFVQRHAHGLRHLAQLHRGRGLGHVHDLGGGAHAAGFSQRQEQSQLAKGDVHRFLSIDNRIRIDFTLRSAVSSIHPSHPFGVENAKFAGPCGPFFALGVFAGLVRSNLEMPAAISKFLSIYLLMALGLKGGFALAASGFTASVASSLGLAVLLAVVVPLMGYALLRRMLSGFNAAAVAATYGSVSAVTFVTATQYLESQSVPYGGYMAAAMALMESPAIILAVMLANALRQRQGCPPPMQRRWWACPPPVQPPCPARAAWVPQAPATAGKAGPHLSVGKILHESFTDGTQLLLLGAMVIGLVTGDAGKAAMQPFSGDLFKGMLCLFLLDMGLSTARNLPAVRKQSPWLLAYAVLGPLVHAGWPWPWRGWPRCPQATRRC